MVSTLCVCASLPTARSGGGDDNAIGNNNNNKKIMLLFSHPNFCGLYTSLRMKKKKYKIGCVCLCRQSGNGSARGAIH